MNKYLKTNINNHNGNGKLVIGVIAGILIGGATVGIAANNYVQALLNQEIKVSLNGEIQTFRDETTGEVQYPLTYNDRTYLPLRIVAQLSGLEVDYNNESKTAILSSKSINYMDQSFSERTKQIKDYIKNELQKDEYDLEQYNFNDSSDFISNVALTKEGNHYNLHLTALKADIVDASEVEDAVFIASITGKTEFMKCTIYSDLDELINQNRNLDELDIKMINDYKVKIENNKNNGNNNSYVLGVNEYGDAIIFTKLSKDNTKYVKSYLYDDSNYGALFKALHEIDINVVLLKDDKIYVRNCSLNDKNEPVTVEEYYNRALKHEIVGYYSFNNNNMSNSSNSMFECFNGDGNAVEFLEDGIMINMIGGGF